MRFVDAQPPARCEQTRGDAEEFRQVGHPVQNADSDEREIKLTGIRRQVLNIRFKQARAETGGGSKHLGLSEEAARLVDAQFRLDTERGEGNQLARVVTADLHDGFSLELKPFQCGGQKWVEHRKAGLCRIFKKLLPVIPFCVQRSRPRHMQRGFILS